MLPKSKEQVPGGGQNDLGVPDANLIHQEAESSQCLGASTLALAMSDQMRKRVSSDLVHSILKERRMSKDDEHQKSVVELSMLQLLLL